MAAADTPAGNPWPPLPLDAWRDTHATLHLWLQIVGKIRLTQMPWLNHGWHVTLYVSAAGLTTGPIPHGARTFQVDVDFVHQHVVVRTDDGRTAEVPLARKPTRPTYASKKRRLEAKGARSEVKAGRAKVVD